MMVFLPHSNWSGTNLRQLKKEQELQASVSKCWFIIWLPTRNSDGQSWSRRTPMSSLRPKSRMRWLRSSRLQQIASANRMIEEAAITTTMVTTVTEETVVVVAAEAAVVVTMIAMATIVMIEEMVKKFTWRSKVLCSPTSLKVEDKETTTDAMTTVEVAKMVETEITMTPGTTRTRASNSKSPRPSQSN